MSGLNLEQLQQAFARIEARQALHELNVRYAMGVDRRDRAALAALWWPEAVIDFGLFKGCGEEFAALVSAPNPAVEISDHFISNELFEIDGAFATGRSYVIGVSSLVGEGGRYEQMVGGRYLDKYEQREGIWKFRHRLFVVDWMVSQPSNAVWTDGIGALAARGRPDGNDVSHAFFRD